MVWFVFQVLRSPETEFSISERKEILERITQIFSFELEPFSNLLHKIWIDYFGRIFSSNISSHSIDLCLAILKTSHGLEQRLLISWLYGINGKQQTLEKSVLLTFQQYIQWHWLESQSIHLLFGILLRKFDRHGEELCAINEMISFIFHLLFPSAKIDGYVSEKLNDIEAQQIFEYGEILVNHLNSLTKQRDPLIESLWIEIENAFVRRISSHFSD